MLKPRRLEQGDTIGVLSPSYALERPVAEPALDRLAAEGFRIKIAKNAFKTTCGYAASPQERADDFNGMVDDDSVSMLLFGGGEVCNEILPLIDYGLARRKPKIILSYSDSTTVLNALASKSGLVTYYGQSLRTFAGLSEYNRACFRSAFMGGGIPAHTANSPWKAFSGGRCRGRLTGGYLVNFAVMMGGGYLRYDRAESQILFLEDHIRFSSPAVVSKYLSHIEQSGFLDSVSGILFGHYSEEPVPVFDDVLRRLADRRRIPVVACGDFGHGDNNAVLPIGLEAELDADSLSLRFLEGFVI